MSIRTKKVLAVIVVILIAFSWVVLVKGIPGKINPLDKKIQLGLDIKGGVYVVLQANTNEKGTKLQKLMMSSKILIIPRNSLRKILEKRYACWSMVSQNLALWHSKIKSNVR